MNFIEPSKQPQRSAVVDMLSTSAAAIQACEVFADEIATTAERIGEAFDRGNKLLVCGNGGSAADAQHLAGELMGRFVPWASARAPRAAIALSADGAVLTGIANDYAFEDVFARQVRALASEGDVLMGISTSGASPNVLNAFAAARPGVLTVALCGRGGRLGQLAHIALRVPADTTAQIQAAHIAIIHAMCLVLELRFAAPATEP
ncbi:MAG: SIS domain-containing protein [Chloroflexota bacterium]|nr:SIS domain-containing protein [Chloroflexota bacterium]